MGNIVPYIALVPLAFVCELLDSALGGGYGTIIVPILLLSGISRVEAVAAILFSETFTGLTAAAEHHRLGNVSFCRGTRETQAAIVIASLAIAGAITSAWFGWDISKQVVNTYIGLMLVGIGGYILLRHPWQRMGSYAGWKSCLLGLWAGFNKGLSGGGFGPLVTGGLLLSGLGKRAMGTTSLAEGITAMVGLGVMVLRAGTDPAQHIFNWPLTLTLTAGAMASVTLAAYIVKRLPLAILRPTVSCVIIMLGIALLVKGLM